MSFRIRSDGMLDARYGPRLGWGRRSAGSEAGAGCATIILLASLGAIGLIVAPLLAPIVWAALEVRQLTLGKPIEGFRFTAHETQQLTWLEAQRVEVDRLLYEVDATGAQLNLQRNIDGHFDRRNPHARALEDQRAHLHPQRDGIVRSQHAIWTALTTRYTDWGSYVPLLWSLRVVVCGWVVLSAVTSSDVMLRGWWSELMMFGSPQFELAALAARTIPLVVVAAIGGVLGYAIGAIVVRVRRPAELSSRVMLHSGLGVLSVGGYLTLMGLGLVGLFFLSQWKPASSVDSTPATVSAGTKPVASDAAVTRCGTSERAPTGRKISGPWRDYRCLAADKAGALWAQCLPWSAYTETDATGCPGAELCCPARNE